MGKRTSAVRRWHALLVAWIILSLAAGCGFTLPALGKAGKYRSGRAALIKPRGAGVGEAITLLQALAREDPLYRDTLTLLGRAYYHQGAYHDASQILERALLVNKEDAIAWLTLGLARLRLGDDHKGFESFKTGIALLNKVSKDGYRGYLRWDINGLVRSSIRRALVLVAKDNLESRDELIGAGELILRRMDDEEGTQQSEARRRLYDEEVRK